MHLLHQDRANYRTTARYMRAGSALKKLILGVQRIRLLMIREFKSIVGHTSCNIPFPSHPAERDVAVAVRLHQREASPVWPRTSARTEMNGRTARVIASVDYFGGIYWALGALWWKNSKTRRSWSSSPRNMNVTCHLTSLRPSVLKSHNMHEPGLWHYWDLEAWLQMTANGTKPRSSSLQVCI